jgi:hypothetical protein
MITPSHELFKSTLKAKYTHKQHGELDLLIYFKDDNTTTTKRYGWTINNGVYGSNLNASYAEVNLLLLAIQRHKTTSNFRLV